MKLKSMRDLLIHELQDLHSAEAQLTDALPRMAKFARNPDLKAAIETHLEETKAQLDRVAGLLDTLEAKPGKAKQCIAMAGIIKEGEELMKEKGEDAILDAALIGAAQRVEHYEIAAYGTARAFAELIGETEAEEVLSEILDEESATDEKLSEIAENVNREAAEMSDGEGEEEQEEAEAE